MLNCCIEHKKKREQLHKGYTGETYYSGSDFGPSTSRISRTFSDEGDNEEMDIGDIEGEEEGEGATQGEEEIASERITEGDTRTIVSSSDDDEDEFFECDADDDDNQSAEKKSENLTEEKEIDESIVNQSETVSQSANVSGDQTGAVGQLSDKQTMDETGSLENTVSNAEVKSNCDNQSKNTQIALADNRDVTETGTSSIDQSQSISAAVNLSENVIGSVSSPRDSLSNMSVQSDSAFLETFTHKPEGRLAPYQDLYLVNCTERMYIPVTQEPAPMTEDMLEEHAEVLAK